MNTNTSSGGDGGNKKDSININTPRANQLDDNTETNGVSNDNLMWRLFRPVQGSLKAVKSATEAAIPDRVGRAAVLKEGLVKIGDLVVDLADDQDADDAKLQASFWNFVASFWPNANRSGAEVRYMYERVVEVKRQLSLSEQHATDVEDGDWILL